VGFAGAFAYSGWTTGSSDVAREIREVCALLAFRNAFHLSRVKAWALQQLESMNGSARRGQWDPAGAALVLRVAFS